MAVIIRPCGKKILDLWRGHEFERLNNRGDDA